MPTSVDEGTGNIVSTVRQVTTRFDRRLAVAALLAVGCSGPPGGAAGSPEPHPTYRDATRPIAARVADLASRMTLEEKFWQLLAYPDDPRRPVDSVPGLFGLQVREDGTSESIVRRMAALQRRAVTGTRLGIPLLFFEEALHGVTQSGATAFPQAIGLAATWDTGLVARVATAIAGQARRRGIRQVLSPVVNLASDPRWGRVEETYGEDPFLTARLGLAFIGAFERQGIATTPKHFVANAGDGGRDSYPVETSWAWLAETHFLPFETAVREGKARAVMAAYNSVNGFPASANPVLLDEWLRRRWGFEGVVISDAGGVGGAAVLHRTVAGYPESAAEAVNAGLDVIFQGGGERIKELFWPGFAPGAIAPDAVDRAVRRVLRLKFELGLFDEPLPDSAAQPIALPEDRALALEAATRSLVLLQNDGLLPLTGDRGPVAVIGVDATEARLGGYSGPGNAIVSIRAALDSRLGAERVRYAPGPGRRSPQAVVVPAAAFEGPVRLELFRGIAPAGPPAATTEVPSIDANWTLGPPDSALDRGWYSARWSGRLRVPAGQPIRIGVDGPDGYRLRLDGRLVIDRWSKRTAGLEMVDLGGGRTHELMLEYHETAGPAKVRLMWTAGADRTWRRRIGEAAAAARGARVAIVVVGLEEGEFRDRASLRLPGHQEELISAVAATGVPVAVVVVGGSAVITRPWSGAVGAILQAWYPGEMGGHAIVATLFGDQSPGGKLPLSFPKAEGQLPLPYYHRPSGRGDDYDDLSGAAEFPFGYGLSYTTFEYADLAIGRGDPVRGDTVTVTFMVRNTGNRSGDEVAQLYLRQEEARIARPTLSLAGFARINLAAGEARPVSIRLAPERFAHVDEDLKRVIGPGRFLVLVGGSSVDFRLRGLLEPTAGTR